MNSIERNTVAGFSGPMQSRPVRRKGQVIDKMACPFFLFGRSGWVCGD